MQQAETQIFILTILHLAALLVFAEHFTGSGSEM
jgi:hypothetical protein